MTSPMFQPVAVLLFWTMIMWLWMYATRLPAMTRAKVDVPNMVGSTGADLEKILPREVQWKAHNYNHLMAEPTVFYATAIALAVLGKGQGMVLAVAWIYVALRIAHSLFQALVNRVLYRFMLFAGSSVCLIFLTVALLVSVF